MGMLVLMVLALGVVDGVFSFPHDGIFSLSVPIQSDSKVTKLGNQLDQINGRLGMTIASFQNQTTEQDEINRRLEKNIALLQNQTKEQDEISRRLGDILSKLDSQNIQKSEQDQIIGRLEKTIALLQTKTKEQDQTNQEMKKTIETLDKEQDEIRGRLEDMLSKLDSQSSGKSKVETDIAYQVVLSPAEFIKKYTSCERAQFDKILMNRGGGYNSGNGYFTAPVSGMYLFWAHVTNGSSEDLYINVWKEVAGKLELMARGYYKKGKGSVVNISAVIYLQRGWRSCFSLCGRTPKLLGSKFSSYGGVLIYPL